MQKTRGPCSLFVKPSWLAEKLRGSANNFRLLDASWHMPHKKRCARSEYLQQHIPTAQFFDIDACANLTSPYAHTIPKPGQFEQYVGALGIDNHTHVVVYDNNEELGLFTAQRAWWTFRTFGHDHVSILEGGLPGWLQHGGDTTTVIDEVPVKKFNAIFRSNLYKSFEDMVQNLETKEFTVVDTRSHGHYSGTEKERTEGLKPGHIAGALSLPYRKLLDLEKKVLKSPDELRAVFKEHDVDLRQPVIASCGSGVSACILALAAYTCGKPDVPVYDGSWIEWYHRAEPDQKEAVPDCLPEEIN